MISHAHKQYKVPGQACRLCIPGWKYIKYNFDVTVSVNFNKLNTNALPPMPPVVFHSDSSEKIHTVSIIHPLQTPSQSTPHPSSPFLPLLIWDITSHESPYQHHQYYRYHHHHSHQHHYYSHHHNHQHHHHNHQHHHHDHHHHHPKNRPNQHPHHTITGPSKELPVGEDERSHHGPGVDEEAHPAWGDLHPHGWLVEIHVLDVPCGSVEGWLCTMVGLWKGGGCVEWLVCGKVVVVWRLMVFVEWRV